MCYAMNPLENIYHDLFFMIKALIFDYDGTIADSVNIKTEAFAELYRPYGRAIEKKVVEYHLSHGGVSRFDKFKFFHKNFLNLLLNEQEIQKLANKFSKLVVDKVINAPYIPGAYEFISKNVNIYDMFISTATPTDEINKILKKKKIIKYFKGVYGSPQNKVKHTKEIISSNNYLLNEVIFIGDSDSDREASLKNNIPFIAIDNKSHFDKEKYKVQDLNTLEPIILKIDIKENDFIR